MTYRAIVGLEIHLQLVTNTKLFSGALTDFGALPNSQIAPLDMAFPGSMPTINERCVKAAIKMANALDMSLSETMTFDRKNYFYSDLAKGYQLTQYFNPLGRDGQLLLTTAEGEKVIHVTRLHLEEDTAKQVHVNNETWLDFNRAGVGLIEIVTAPDFNSGVEAEQFAKLMQKLALKLKISTGKMQEGAMRVDVNVSLQKEDSAFKGVVVEIKNLNSFRNIARAVNAEIKRQKILLESKEALYPETRRYDEINNLTIFMRRKQQKNDYHYFPETNIAPIKLSQDLIDMAVNEDKPRGDVLADYTLTTMQKSVLTRNPYLKTLFIKLINKGLPSDFVANFLAGKVQAALKIMGAAKLQKIEEETITLLALYQAEKISSKQLTTFYQQLLANKSLNDIYNSDNDAPIASEQRLAAIIDEVLLECHEAVIAYRQGKDKSLNYILGQIYRKTNNQVDPKITKALLLKKMED